MSDPLPLAGFRVIELALYINGPMGGSVLGRLGAEIIRVEQPNVVDQNRNSRESYNLNKRSVTIDLTRPAGQTVLHDLVRQSDVFLTNLRPLSLVQMGADDKTLQAVNPNLVYAHGTLFGQYGPRANVPGQNTTATAAAGLLYLNRDDDGTPREIPGTTSDTLSGTMIAVSALVGLLQRERNGKAPIVRSTMVGTNMWYQYLPISRYATAGELPLPAGQRANANPLYGRFMCSNGQWFFFTQAVETHRYWPRVCRMLGIEELEDDARFATHEARLQHAAELVAIMEPIFAQKTAQDWEKLFSEYELWGTPINDYEHLVADPEIIENHFIEQTASGLKVVAMPFEIVGAEKTPMTAPSALGADTEDVLTKICGYDPVRIKELQVSGAV
ncbi:MAG: CoA transferase [Dehalococcoidia bacterium]|nr:CoA transferase [Dehalococcoidia bacterium]